MLKGKNLQKLLEEKWAKSDNELSELNLTDYVQN